MAFEKNSPETLFFNYVEEFLKSAKSTIDNCKFNKRAREENLSANSKQRTKNTREKVCDFIEISGPKYYAEDLLERFFELFSQLECYEKVNMEQYYFVKSKIAKLYEKIDSIKHVQLALQMEEDADITEYMSKHFENEHMWKKDIPEELLYLLEEFEKTKNSKIKRILQSRLSMLSSSIIKGQTSNTLVLTSENDLPDSISELNELLTTITTRSQDLEKLHCKLSIAEYALKNIVNEANDII